MTKQDSTQEGKSGSTYRKQSTRYINITYVRGGKKKKVLSIDIEKATGIEKAIGKTQHLIIKN